MVPLRIGDEAKVTAYYEGALKHFQQLNCRMVAKAFIKFIEPRKQVRHPYNGGKPPAGSAPGTTGDPEKTKPEWWPPGVMHKEPDHLRKECEYQMLPFSVQLLTLTLSRPNRASASHYSKTWCLWNYCGQAEGSRWRHQEEFEAPLSC